MRQPRCGRPSAWRDRLGEAKDEVGIDLRRPAEPQHGDAIDREGLQREPGIDAEIAAAGTAAGPEQVGVVARIGHQPVAGGGDQLGLDELVGADPVGARAEADAAAEQEAGGTDRRAAAVGRGDAGTDSGSTAASASSDRSISRPVVVE